MGSADVRPGRAGPCSHPGRVRVVPGWGTVLFIDYGRMCSKARASQCSYPGIVRRHVFIVVLRVTRSKFKMWPEEGAVNLSVAGVAQGGYWHIYMCCQSV